MDDWESAAEQNVVLRPKPTSDVNKWAGEDDDDDVKDNWEDEEEKKDEEKTVSVKAPVKKLTTAEKKALEEAKRLEEEELERKYQNMTPEEKIAEKLRLQKIQEENDLKSALETFGVESIQPLDSYNPKTKEEFKDFGSALSWKLNCFKSSPHYTQFWEDFLRSALASMPASELKKVKMVVENLHSEKLKMEKQSKKPVNKGKSRATIRTELNDIDSYQNYANDYEDYDDFM